ncbi:competence type IV pilus minor pilin ComGG [Streptococcus phocae subsp. phocae]
MRFKKTVKASILPYALFMASAFLLLLQVYLDQVSNRYREYQAQSDALKAQLMAEMIYQERPQTDGAVTFNHGKAQYQLKEKDLVVTVTLNKQQEYRFQYTKASEPVALPSEDY